MSDFVAKIRAVLDDSKIENEIKTKIESKKITLSNFTLNTKLLPSQIQASLDNHKFKIVLDGIKLDNIGTQASKAGTSIGRNIVQQINKELVGDVLGEKIRALKDQFNSLFSASNANGRHMELQKIQADLIELSRLERAMKSSPDDQTLLNSYNNFKIILNETKHSLKALELENKSFVSSLQVQKLDNQIATWMQKNTKATQDFGDQIQILRSQLQEMISTGNVSTAKFNDIKTQFQMIKSEASAAGKVGMTFSDV